MKLNSRINLLKDAGQIDEDTYKKILKVVSMLDNKWNIKLTEENGAMFITHLSIALQRIKKGVQVEDIDEGIEIELKSNKYFKKALNIIKNIEETVNVNMSCNEKNYLMIHLCSLLQNIKNN